MNRLKWLSILVAMAILSTGCSDKETKKENIVKVKAMTLTPTNICGVQSYSGSIEEECGTPLSFATMGTIKALYVHEGESVNAGQLIGELESSSSENTANIAHASTQQANEMYKQAEDAYGRLKMLHDNGSLPEIKWVEVETKLSQAKQMLEQAQAAEKIANKGLNDTRLTAPFSGYISQKRVEAGENILPGQAVLSLVKIDRVNVKFSVPEEEIASIKKGQTITFQVASINSTTFTGVISEKNITADPLSRAYMVKATVQNSDHKLLPGMVCDAYLASDKQTMGISLPANIIQIDIDNKPFVWTIKNGLARRVFVDLGENMGENIIVKSGLNSGDKVIIEGQQKVSNGMKVREL